MESIVLNSINLIYLKKIVFLFHINIEWIEIFFVSVKYCGNAIWTLIIIKQVIPNMIIGGDGGNWTKAYNPI